MPPGCGRQSEVRGETGIMQVDVPAGNLAGNVGTGTFTFQINSTPFSIVLYFQASPNCTGPIIVRGTDQGDVIFSPKITIRG